VVGGGAIGLATACELARAGWAVTVVDAGDRRPGTTRVSFARINAAEKTLQPYHELNAAGVAAFHDLAGRGGTLPWLHLTGHLEWASTDERRRALRERTELVESFGYRAERLTGREVKARLEPDLLVPETEEVSFFPDEGHAETAGLLDELRRAATALGIEVRDACVTAVAVSERRPHRVRLETGEDVRGDVVVLAAGRWSGELAELAGSSAPLRRPDEEGVTGFLATTAPTSTSLSRSVFAPRANVRPDAGGRLVVQALGLDGDAFAALAGGVPANVAEELGRRLGQTVALRRPAAVDAVRVGVRALPLDGLPIVGWADGVDDVYVVVTHSGVTLCLVLGRLVAAEIAAGRSEPLLEPFRPGRFASDETTATAHRRPPPL
jgi:glycine/D-amino acid oxidase-like deaminating enzyme